jgi:hypothetical protein
MSDVPGHALGLDGVWAFADDRRTSFRYLNLRIILRVYSLVEGSSVEDDWAVCFKAASKIRGITFRRFSTRRRIPVQALGLK